MHEESDLKILLLEPWATLRLPAVESSNRRNGSRELPTLPNESPPPQERPTREAESGLRILLLEPWATLRQVGEVRRLRSTKERTGKMT